MPGHATAASSTLMKPMNVSLPGTLGLLAARTAPSAGGKAEKAARDFEGVLLTSLFDSLQKSFCFDAQDDASTPGASDYRLMGTRALAEAVSAGGGIGLARLVLSHLQAPKGPGER